MLAIKELRDEIALIRAQREDEVDGLIARLDTLERAVEDARDQLSVAKGRAQASEVVLGDLHETLPKVRLQVDLLETTVDTAKKAIQQRVTEEFDVWRHEIAKRTLGAGALIAVAVVVANVVDKVF